MTARTGGPGPISLAKAVSVPFLLLAACAGDGPVPAARQDRVAAAIERLGGRVEFGDASAGSPIVKVDLHSTAVTDDDLTLLASLTELRTLDLRLTGIGDAGVAHLAGLRQLTFLNLFRTQTTDRGLESLRNLTNLETLLLGGTLVSEAGLANLQGLTRLRKLSLFDTRIGDNGIDALTRLPKLEVLLLGKSNVTEAGMDAIRAAKPGIRFTETIG